MASLSNPRQFLIDLYVTAVAAVSAEKCLPSYLPSPPENGRTLVVGAGKGAAAMEALPGIYAIVCDTDGIDGLKDNAGALYMPDSLSRARKKGVNARRLLESNNGHYFFSMLDDLLVTGPSRTNVNDFRAILIL